MRPALFVTFVGTVAAAAVVGSAQASLVVDDFTAGSINRSSSNTSAQSSVQTETHPSFFPGSTNVRDAWVLGLLGESALSRSNAQSITSNANGSVAFALGAVRMGGTGGDGTTRSSGTLRYGGTGTNLDLSGYTSFVAAGSGSFAIQSNRDVGFTAMLRLTDTAGKNADWTFARAYDLSSTALTTYQFGDISFNLSLAQGLPGSPVVAAGFNIASIQRLEFVLGTYVTTGTSLTPSGVNLNYTFDSLTFVPTPGALALLGVAGLARRRRRD